LVASVTKPVRSKVAPLPERSVANSRYSEPAIPPEVDDVDITTSTATLIQSFKGSTN
jgi:hypothetical protein